MSVAQVHASEVGFIAEALRGGTPGGTGASGSAQASGCSQTGLLGRETSRARGWVSSPAHSAWLPLVLSPHSALYVPFLTQPRLSTVLSSHRNGRDTVPDPGCLHSQTCPDLSPPRGSQPQILCCYKASKTQNFPVHPATPKSLQSSGLGGCRPAILGLGEKKGEEPGCQGECAEARAASLVRTRVTWAPAPKPP